MRERHLGDGKVEALYFRYLHFYGNQNTVANSPRWYRREVRAVRNNIPIWGPKGLFFSVVTGYLRMRYPRAAFADATIYHYGWIRSEEQFNEKWKGTFRHFTHKPYQHTAYAEIDPQVLQPFAGTHPKAVQDWLPPAEGLFRANPDHVLTRRERKNRFMMVIEKWTGLDTSRKHFKKID